MQPNMTFSNEQQHQHFVASFTMTNSSTKPMPTPVTMPTYNSTTTVTYTDSAASSYCSLGLNNNNSNNNSQPMMMNYEVTEASVSSSSMGIRTPDMHPVPDMIINIPSNAAAMACNNTLVAQMPIYGNDPNTAATMMMNHQHHQHHHYAAAPPPPYNMHLHSGHQPTTTVVDPIIVWPTMESGTSISYPSASNLMNSIKATQQQQQQEFSGINPIANNNISQPVAYHLDSDQGIKAEESKIAIVKQEEDEDTTILSSMRKSPHNRRNTVSLPLLAGCNQDDDNQDQDIRRQSMNDLLKNNFCHLSREELIQRVVQLEKEKLSTSFGVANASATTTASTSPVLDLHSDEDMDNTHPCRWAGCDTSATSLDQLITHIRNVHIGSGKAAYYCEWHMCSRNQKPFLKRHKMQNHMRTHTGERPFECQVDRCDKKFSRPDSLNTHIKTHSSIRPYACPVEHCSKAYFHSRSLRKHAKSHESLTSSVSPKMVVEEKHPYMKPAPKYYENQQCGRQATTTNFLPTAHRHTPKTNTPNFEPQQIRDSNFYHDVEIVDNFYQQQQQIMFAATRGSFAGTTDITAYHQQQYVSNPHPLYQQQYSMMEEQHYIY